MNDSADRAVILKAANELRQMFGCAYGCCDDASYLLAAMLRKAGLKPTVMRGTFWTAARELVKPIRKDASLHWWVECSGYLVDITADQFNGEISDEEAMPEVVCVPRKQASYRYSKGKTDLSKANPAKSLGRIRGAGGTGIGFQFPYMDRQLKEDLESLGLSGPR